MQPAKVTRPEAAALGLAVQVSAAPLVPVPEVIERVTEAELEVTVLPSASWIASVGWVAHTTPPVPPLGCWVKPSCTAAPGLTLKAALAALVRPVLEAVSL